MNERDIARALAEREHGQCEVQTPAGFIDVLTPTWVYEVKAVRHWKAALGQVIAYARYYPKHKPALYLFGTTTPKQRALIREHCASLHVKVVWHKELIPAPVAELTDAASTTAPITSPTIPKDALTLRLAAMDRSHTLSSACSITLMLPEARPSQERFQAYFDEAWAVFDSLLDNELTLTLRSTVQGESIKLERARKDVDGEPLCYKFVLSVMTNQARTFTVSLPGIKNTFASGSRINTRHNLASDHRIPELNRLYALILHPVFPWVNNVGSRATSIRRAYWRSYGMTKTKTGWRMGG